MNDFINILCFSCAVLCLIAQSCLTLCTPMDCSPPGSCVHGDSPGKNTGAGCHALLQGIFPTQGSRPGVTHCRQIPPGQPKNTGVGIPSLLRDSDNPEIDPGSPESQADSLPAELPGKPFVSPMQFCILNSSHIFSSMFTICSRWYLLCFFPCDFIFSVYA